MPTVTPGGADKTIQYNANGTFGGVTYSSYPDDQGGVLFDKLQTYSFYIGPGGVRMNSATVGGEPACRLYGAGSSLVAAIVCQPFTRDVGIGTTLGTVTGWAKVYDADGTYLGKSPIYDDIT